MAPPHSPRPRQINPSAITILALSGMGVAGALLYAGLSEEGIGVRPEWVWNVTDSPQYESLGGPLILSGAILLCLGWVVLKCELSTRRREAAALSGVVLLLLLLQMAVAGLGPGGSLETVFASYPPANAYFDRATRITTAREYLADYQREIEEEEFRVQLSTHPPGSVLFYYPFVRASQRWPELFISLRDFARRSAPTDEAYAVPEIEGAIRRLVRKPEHEGAVWFAAVALRLLASLVVVPIYLLCRLEFPPAKALTAAFLAATVPSIFLFNPHPDQFFPLVSASFVLLILVGVRGFRWWAAAAAAIALFLGLFCSLSFLAPAFTGFLVCAIAVWRRPSRRHLLLVAAGLVAFAGPVLFLLIAFDYDSFGVWQACSAQNDEFNAHSGRTYWKWLLFNPFELAIFSGLPLFVVYWRFWMKEANHRWLHGELRPGVARSAGLPDEAARNSGPEVEVPDQRPPAGLGDLVIALGATFVLLNLSGKNLGEVGRLWMILMPMMGVAAALTWNEWTKKDEGFVLSCVALQIAQLIGLRLFVDAMGLFSFS